MLTNKSSGEELPPSILQLVQIYFDTATFDDVEKDKKIKVEAQLSLIGGTMGLLTGFSIISGVEIIFFLFRLVNTINDIKGLLFYLPSGSSVPSGSKEPMLWRSPKRSFKTT